MQSFSYGFPLAATPSAVYAALFVLSLLLAVLVALLEEWRGD